MKKEFAEFLVQTDAFKIEQLTQLFEQFAAWKSIKFEGRNTDRNFNIKLLERTEFVLQIIINVAPFLKCVPQREPKIHLQEFVKNCLEKRHIEPQLRDLYIHSDGYFSGSSIRDGHEESLERIDELKIFYRNLSKLITAYAKLFRFKDITILEFTEEAVFKPVGYQVLSLLNYSKLDPLILNACSIFLLNLMKHPNVEFAADTKIHLMIQSSLNDYVPLMWFLWGSNYDTLCWMSSLHTKNPVMSVDSEFEPCDVADQRTPEIQEAFFHVIRVIKLLSTSKHQNTRGTRTAQYCADLCTKSAFIKERNAALLKAWELPNDNVKLLICRVFSGLAPTVWQLEDLKAFADLLREMKSLNRSNFDEVSLLFRLK